MPNKTDCIGCGFYDGSDCAKGDMPKTCESLKTDVYLDYKNGWKEEPEIVRTCRELKHTIIGYGQQFRCAHRYGCPICRYTYGVDSGD